MGKEKIIALVSDGCPHCQEQKPILQRMKKQGYNIDIKNVDDPKNKALVQKVAGSIDKRGKDFGIPWTGFSCDGKTISKDRMGTAWKKELKAILNGTCSIDAKPKKKSSSKKKKTTGKKAGKKKYKRKK